MNASTPTHSILDKTPQRLRHEVKFAVNYADAYLLSSRLSKVFTHDAHAGANNTYRVTSLYFDTPYDDALVEKIEGMKKREKFRIRFYGAEPQFLSLEKKLKNTGLCGKRSARLSVAQVERLLAGDYGFLIEEGDPLLSEFYSKLQGKLLAPRSIVSYEREAFTYRPGNVRITIDRDLRCSVGAHGWQGFPFKNDALAPVNPGTAVVEVKYDGYLPDIVKDLVHIPNRMATAYSKYAFSRVWG